MKNLSFKITITTILACFFICAFYSCNDFLDFNPKGSISYDRIQDAKGAELLVTAAYASLGNGNEYSNISDWIWGSVRSDDAYKGGASTGDQSQLDRYERFAFILADQPYTQNVWIWSFEAIGRANVALAVINDLTEAEYPLKKQRQAEMRFIRAHNYFWLVKTFKHVPWIGEDVATQEYKTISNREFTRDELYNKIAEDLQSGIDNLPDTQNEIGRVSRIAATAYLAKTRLYQAYEQDEVHNVININTARLNEVVELCDYVIESGEHALSSDYAENFLWEHENGPESIFAIQYSMADGTPLGRMDWSHNLNYNMSPGGYGCCSFHRPSFNMVNAFKTDASGLPLFNTFNDDLIEPGDSFDPRISHTVGIPDAPFKYDNTFIYSASWARAGEVYGPYSTMKEILHPASPGLRRDGSRFGSARNQDILRYDDLLLWKAEALIELGRHAEALPLINMIRQRAANSTTRLKFADGSDPLPYNVQIYEDAVNSNWTQDFARTALRWERRLEFALEGSRFYDLVRWGIAAETLNEYFEVESTRRVYLREAFFQKNRNEYLPIPQQEINLSEGLYQQNRDISLSLQLTTHRYLLNRCKDMKPNDSKNSFEKNEGRRKFLKNAALLTGTGVAGIPGLAYGKAQEVIKENPSPDSGESLYNGIKLPSQWPPKTMIPDSYDPMPLPYLASPPRIVPIDVGRQLFVDDFLIEKTNLKRKFHQPVKHENNPLLTPQTKVEMNQGYCPTASPFSDGVFYDPKDKLFKMWYMAGWFDGTALATSTDGIKWERPQLDVVQGTNLVLNPDPELRRDGASVWLDHDATDPAERFKMYWWARRGKIGDRLKEEGGFLLSSPDGIHWKWHGKIGETGDNSTFFYNPFRKVWCFTVRKFGRAAPPWAAVAGEEAYGTRRGRARSYWENKNFFAALGKWEGFEPVFWFGADRLDNKRPNYDIGEEPQIYKVDAAGYESLMIGFIQPHYGPSNGVCAKGGFPKLTELQLAFSRDGFHWDRTSRATFIGATLKKDSWERAYIHSIGGVCNIVGDKLHFYYTAFKGNEANRNPIGHWNGLYANASTGLAILRRDGFASMQADKNEGMLLTRILKFGGKYLFVNIDGRQGSLVAEICQDDGTPIQGFTRGECVPIKADSTKQPVTWKGGQSLETLANKNVRFKFHLTNGKLYSFWVSKNLQGNSGGATAGGGPGFSGSMDV